MIDKIKRLREQTGISVSECKKALEEARGDIERAKEVLRKKGKEFAEKKTAREASQGLIASYIHNNKKLGVLLDIRCESDFVAKSDDFQALAKEICMQIAAMAPSSIDKPGEKEKDAPLLSQPWIKDESRTIKDLIDEYVARVGENIKAERFERYEI